jgi:hypothetical protein
MNNQEIDVGGDGALKGNNAGVNRGTDLRNRAAIRHLQPIESGGRVLEGGASRARVTIRDEIDKTSHSRKL